MQMLKFPQQINKLNRYFLWGDTEDNIGGVFVNLKPTEVWGLGNWRRLTKALNAKLSWKVMNNDKALWVKMVRAKYHWRGTGKQKKNKGSVVWK